jgi:hypothetical protein
MVIGYAKAQREHILTLDESPLSGKAESFVIPVVPKPLIATPWEYQFDLDHLTPMEREKVLRTLRPHRELWDGRLGNVSATSHRIEVVPGSRPVHAQPYRAGGRAREAEQKQIKQMLTQGVI